jgi:hypothetical protein
VPYRDAVSFWDPVLQNYFYKVELLVDLGGELGVPVRVNGHRWWTAEAS